jgi:hypothetical protein
VSQGPISNSICGALLSPEGTDAQGATTESIYARARSALFLAIGG